MLRRALVLSCLALALSSLPPYLVVVRAAITRYDAQRFENYNISCGFTGADYACDDIDVGSGTDRALVMAIGIPSSDLLISATYNGDALTCPAGANAQDAGDRRVQLCYLLNPDSGMHTLLLHWSSAPDAQVSYVLVYEGVSTVESVAEDDDPGTTSLPVVLTTTASAVLVSYGRENVGTAVTWTNGIVTELFTSGGAHVADSAGVTTSAGATTITPTVGGAYLTAHVALSLAEPSAGGGGGVIPKLTLLGVGDLR